MLNIVQLHHIQATIVVLVSYFIIREIIIKYRNRKEPKKCVGIINPEEVDLELKRERDEVIRRRNELPNMKSDNFNNLNEILKADRNYSAKINQLHEDQNKLF